MSNLSCSGRIAKAALEDSSLGAIGGGQCSPDRAIGLGATVAGVGPARAILKAAIEPVTIYDVTGTLRVPTFATCLGEKVVAYSTHCDSAQALSMGLEQALQQYQSEQFQQLDYAVAPVPDLPSALRSDQLSVPCYMLPDAWLARREWLLQKLQSNGLRAFVVPLGHDPALVQVLPFIVRVLLSRRELKEGE